MSDQKQEYPRGDAPRRPRNEYYPKVQRGNVARPRNEYYPTPAGETKIRPRNESGMPGRPKAASPRPEAPKSVKSEKKKSSFADIFKKLSSPKKTDAAKKPAPKKTAAETRTKRPEPQRSEYAGSAPVRREPITQRSYGTSGLAQTKSTVGAYGAAGHTQTRSTAGAYGAGTRKKSASSARTFGTSAAAPRNAAGQRSSIDSYLDAYNKTSDWLDDRKRKQEEKKAEAKAREEAKKARKAARAEKEVKDRAKKSSGRTASKDGTAKRKSATELLDELKSRREKSRQEAVGEDGKRKRKTGLALVKAVVIRSLIYLVIAGVISAGIISVANDAFALTKVDTTEIQVNIPDGASTKDIAKILHKNKLIKYEFAYVLYAKMTKEDGTAKFGDFIFSYYMTYDNIMTTLKRGSFSETNPNDVRILIPEGYECDQIIDLLVSNGLGSREVFEDVINHHDFGYNFIDKIPEDRSGYRLEGYLFPDTYIFSKTEGEVSIIKRMLLNFDRKITVDLYDRMNEIGYTLDETITLASIIEREAGTVTDMPLISSVFHNRLNSDSRYLESDATLQFVMNERKDIVTYEDTELDSPYNTYQYAGLPPGPIASPGLAAIKAALYPEDTKYFYFVARGDGTSVFAETYEDHQRNVTVASRTWGN
ncbi:MAG: endolytic transglycosylase MltG [Clostridia bacterium]|nr:endolytic transglycosylase MltG [Clostridia bacterium]